jgi:AcrR family transcriptional regulator
MADIMQAAHIVFAEKGFSDALMSDIAERAGIVEGSIYRFFASKRELLIKLLEQWCESLVAEDDSQLAGIRGTWNRLRFVIHRHLTTIKREPALTRLLLQDLRSAADYRKLNLFQLNKAYTSRIAVIVKDAVASGEFRTGIPPSLVRDMVYGAAEHRTWAFLRNEGDFDIDTVADGITDLIYRGLAVSSAPDPLAATTERLERVAGRLEALATSGSKTRA